MLAHCHVPILISQSRHPSSIEDRGRQLLQSVDQQVMTTATPTLAFVRLFRTIDTDFDNRISKEDLFRHQDQEGFSSTFAEVRTELSEI